MQEWLAGALATQGRSALLVSHDVEETLYLCDPAIVLSARPAVGVAELSVPSPRALPRSQTVADPAFVAQRERALWALQEAAR